MTRTPNDRPVFRSGVLGAVLLACLTGYGCASQTNVAAPRMVAAEHSPVAEEVAPADAWRFAEAYAATHPRCEVVVGSGDSMLPVYRDRTVLVLQLMEMSELRRGMTVVFYGDSGRPVAHTLVKHTPRGWIAMGAGNREPDDTPVRLRNYLGTVVRAYAPSPKVASLTFQVPAPGSGRLAVSAE